MSTSTRAWAISALLCAACGASDAVDASTDAGLADVVTDAPVDVPDLTCLPPPIDLGVTDAGDVLDAGDPAMLATAAMDAIAAARCDALAMCAGNLHGDDFLATDRATCVRLETQALSSSVQTALRTHLLALDENALGDCLYGLRGCPYDDAPDRAAMVARCGSVIRPAHLGSLDERCVTAADCDDRLACEQPPTCAQRTCRPRRVAGDECASAPDACARDACGGWLACAFDGTRDVCAHVTPVEGPAGARCGRLDRGVLGECAAGLYCEYLAPLTSGVCRAYVADGGNCPTHECGAGLACDLAAHACRPLVRVTTAGSVCGAASVPRAECDPASGLACHAGACTAVGHGSAGDGCGRPGDAPCGFGLGCVNDACAGTTPSRCTDDTQCPNGTCGHGLCCA